jgi:predicted nucleic acid-binding protein
MLVIDANIAIRLVAPETGRDAVLQRLEREAELFAPDWLLAEAGHALWRKVESGELNQVEAAASLAALPAYFESLENVAPLVGRAQDLAFELDHWIYDTIYLALALERGIKLLTADKKFANAATRAGYGDAVELLSWKDMQQ